MMLKQKMTFVLSQAYSTLSQLEDDHFLIGSAVLKLSGVDIDITSDIDTLTSPRNADKLKVSWKDQLRANYQPEKATRFRSNFAFDFDTMDIEVMGGREVKKNNVWNRVIIQHYFLFQDNGYSIKIPTLEEQKRILILFDRPKDKKKLKLIDNFRVSVTAK